MPKKMNSTQWELYRMIENATNDGKTLTVSEICSAIPFYKYNPKQSNKSNAPKLYEDIFLINCAYNWEHDKYIITNRNKIKLATKEEVIKEYVDVVIKYRRINSKKKALEVLIANDGQYKLLSNDNVPINESKAKEYKESYAKERTSQ